MSFPRPNIHTEDDYYHTPENTHAELIDGQLYYHAAPSRIHQKILNYLCTEINLYIRSKHGSCEVYPAPFAVKLHEKRETIVEPDISVICDSAKLTDKGCTGAPDWIIEITSPSNPEHDYLYKLKYFFEQGTFASFSFEENISANLYEDLQINLKEIYTHGR